MSKPTPKIAASPAPTTRPARAPARAPSGRSQLRGMGFQQGSQRLSAGSARPTALRTVADFIAIVRRVEGAYNEDWRRTVVRLRKVYYSGGNWPQMIAGRENVAPLAPRGALTASDIAALRKAPVLTHNGAAIDVGHVLTGLDAANHPQTAGLVNLAGIKSKAGSTWSGDVGSAVAHYIHDGRNPKLRGKGLNAYYDSYFSAADKLGDLDGLALSKAPAATSGGGKLSGRLTAYYGAKGGHKKRFTLFAQAAGFSHSGGRLDAASRRLIFSQVNNFAQAFFFKLCKDTAGEEVAKSGRATPPLRQIIRLALWKSAVLRASVRFMRWVEAGLASEA